MSKRSQLLRDSGVALYRGIFLGGLSNFGELLINSSFSVEKVTAVTGVSKQTLLFALIIIFLGSAKCFFQ